MEVVGHHAIHSRRLFTSILSEVERGANENWGKLSLKPVHHKIVKCRLKRYTKRTFLIIYYGRNTNGESYAAARTAVIINTSDSPTTTASNRATKKRTTPHKIRDLDHAWDLRRARRVRVHTGTSAASAPLR
jgi:hypothetical protein